MNESWVSYYGHKLGMSAQEIELTRWGELLDLIACEAIFNGAKPKKKRRKMSMEEILNLS